MRNCEGSGGMSELRKRLVVRDGMIADIKYNEHSQKMLEGGWSGDIFHAGDRLWGTLLYATEEEAIDAACALAKELDKREPSTEKGQAVQESQGRPATGHGYSLLNGEFSFEVTKGTESTLLCFRNKPEAADLPDEAVLWIPTDQLAGVIDKLLEVRACSKSQ